MVKIELAYALKDQQTLLTLEIKEGSTVEYAIKQSGLLEQYPEIDLSKNKVGIFGLTVLLEHTLKTGDRIEIYRPLLIDPKQARLLRAQKKQRC